MIRIPFLLLLGTAMAMAKPNIVLFVTDDQSPIAGCYGSPLIKTPHLDALAAEGTLFSKAFATTASCSASRSVILTGLHNHANGQYGHVHDFHKFETFQACAAVSLPLQLRHLGYRTAHIGKLHVAPKSVYDFDEYIRAPHGNNTPAWIEACAPLFAATSGKPFFLCFWTTDPHRSGKDDETAPEKLKANLFGNPPPGESYPGTVETTYDPAEIPVPAFLPDTIECRRELAQYYQSVTRTDLALGRLVEALKEAGQYENTVIIFTSDHGMAFTGAKTSVYEPGLHVPFVVRVPDAEKRGDTSDAMITHADITPTLLDIAGGYDAGKNAPVKLLPVPELEKGENAGKAITGYHGRSWLGVLDGGETTGWDEATASHTFHEIQMYYPMRALRDRQYKLIWNIAHALPYPFASDLWASSTWQAQHELGPSATYGKRTVRETIQRPAFELYDLVADPDESVNLAGMPEHGDRLAAMKERLKTFQKKTGDPWIMKWEYEWYCGKTLSIRASCVTGGLLGICFCGRLLELPLG